MTAKTITCAESADSERGTKEIDALYQQLKSIYGPWQARMLMQRYVDNWNPPSIEEEETES